MGAIVNGKAVHGGLIPYGGTFLVFSDYMRGALRISALSGYTLSGSLPTIRSVWAKTAPHTNRSNTWPACGSFPRWSPFGPVTRTRRRKPGGLPLSMMDRLRLSFHARTCQPLIGMSLPVQTVYSKVLCPCGYRDEDPEVILMASGSEVDLALQAATWLAAESVNVRVVSSQLGVVQSPTGDLPRPGPAARHQSRWLWKPAFPSAGRPGGEHGKVIGIDTFGASAPGELVWKSMDSAFQRDEHQRLTCSNP